MKLDKVELNILIDVLKNSPTSPDQRSEYLKLRLRLENYLAKITS